MNVGCHLPRHVLVLEQEQGFCGYWRAFVVQVVRVVTRRSVSTCFLFRLVSPMQRTKMWYAYGIGMVLLKNEVWSRVGR